MSTDRTITVPMYVQLEPYDRARVYDHAELAWRDGAARAARVVRTSRKRPVKPAPGVLVVAIELRIPAQAFEPLRPTAVIDIPADLTHAVPVVVEATDANAEEQDA